MSIEYDNYLNEHINNVCMAYRWMRLNIPDIVYCSGINYWTDIQNHDASKYSFEEYSAYDNYFYGNKSKSVEEDFNIAWLHHIHVNPHHWQHWVLINDDPNEGTIALDMPYKYVIEMICDWWSFSFKNGNLYEIFDWYNANQNYIILSKNTRNLVEGILSKIRDKLDVQKMYN